MRRKKVVFCQKISFDNHGQIIIVVQLKYLFLMMPCLTFMTSSASCPYQSEHQHTYVGMLDVNSKVVNQNRQIRTRYMGERGQPSQCSRGYRERSCRSARAQSSVAATWGWRSPTTPTLAGCMTAAGSRSCIPQKRIWRSHPEAQAVWTLSAHGHRDYIFNSGKQVYLPSLCPKACLGAGSRKNRTGSDKADLSERTG